MLARFEVFFFCILQLHYFAVSILEVANEVSMFVYPLLHYVIRFVSVFLDMLCAPFLAVFAWIERNYPDEPQMKMMAV